MDRHYMSAPVYGIITDNADPDGIGRVRVGLYNLGKDIQTHWIHIVTPGMGIFVLPEVGDQVVVAFIGDNPDLPIVLGVIWSNKQRPPMSEENAESELNKDGKNNLRLMRSRSGNRVIFDDTKDNEKIQMISSDGTSRIELAAKDTKILLKTTGVMKISAKGKVTINGKECIINAKKGFISKSENIKVEGKEVNVKAGNAIGVKGSGINLN
jgi:uncharacterized protein involved in type VI secretion and phage assembly